MTDLDSTWAWVFLDAQQNPVQLPYTAPTPQPFVSQSDAETWVGEHWRELLELGVMNVTLRRDDIDVYTMGLESA
jgi:hypothetical protein